MAGQPDRRQSTETDPFPQRLFRFVTVVRRHLHEYVRCEIGRTKKYTKPTSGTTRHRNESDVATPSFVALQPAKEPDWEKIRTELGYDPRNAMRQAKDGSWLRNHVDVLANDVDEDSIRKKLVGEKLYGACEKAVKQFNDLLPGAKFDSYGDAANPAKKKDLSVLKACAWVQDVQWETVLKYMVEGKDGDGKAA